MEKAGTWELQIKQAFYAAVPFFIHFSSSPPSRVLMWLKEIDWGIIKDLFITQREREEEEL